MKRFEDSLLPGIYGFESNTNDQKSSDFKSVILSSDISDNSQLRIYQEGEPDDADFEDRGQVGQRYNTKTNKNIIDNINQDLYSEH